VEAQFWHSRWQDNLIAFHKTQPNAFLQKHYHDLHVPEGGRVLVPLCGKSVDMVWLRAQGAAVTGVELSAIAVTDFFAEQGIAAHRGEEGAFTVLEGDGIRLLEGDFFALEPRQVAEVSAVYDRAALVALPDEMRRRYVDHLLSLLAPQVPILLLTFEYPAAEMEGPPFCVDEGEVRALFAGRRRVTRLDSQARLEQEPKLAERGLTALREHAFLLDAL
jgi:thiopurine S-methyltransferase